MRILRQRASSSAAKASLELRITAVSPFGIVIIQCPSFDAVGGRHVADVATTCAIYLNIGINLGKTKNKLPKICTSAVLELIATQRLQLDR
jgi:hypothetical protein